MRDENRFSSSPLTKKTGIRRNVHKGVNVYISRDGESQLVTH